MKKKKFQRYRTSIKKNKFQRLLLTIQQWKGSWNVVYIHTCCDGFTEAEKIFLTVAVRLNIIVSILKIEYCLPALRPQE